MLRLSFRELGGVGLWCHGSVCCILLGRGVWGYMVPRENWFFQAL